MNDLVASSVCWTICTSSRTSPRALAGSEATSRSTICAWSTMLVRLWAGPSCMAREISRRRSSWAPSRSRDTAGDSSPSSLAAGPASPAAVAIAAGRLDVGGQGVAVAREDPLLAVEDLDLGLHQRGALGERQELRVLLERGGRITAACRARRNLLGRLGAATFVAGCLHGRLGHEQVDLDELLLDRVEVVRQPDRERDRFGWRGGLGFGHQSSGIRIQPWRIAYTTACVRSLTDSLRRIELMWFLTVCSEIDSA